MFNDDPLSLENTIGAILADRRKKLGLTQEAVAIGVNILSPEFIGLVERGKRHFDLNKIPKFAHVLGLPGNRLVEVYLNEHAPEAYKVLFEAANPLQVNISMVESDLPEIFKLFRQLDMEDQEDLLDLLRWRLARKEERKYKARENS